MRNGLDEGFSEKVRVNQQQLESQHLAKFDYIVCGAGTSGSMPPIPTSSVGGDSQLHRMVQIPTFARNITLFALALFASFSNAEAQQTLTADQTQIVDTVKTVFAAAKTDNVALFNTVVGRNFYPYDGGIRLVLQ
jgi:hypothetical protein